MSEGALPSPLEQARQEAGLSMEDLWTAYLGLGGTSSLPDVAAFVTSTAEPSPYEHDLLAQALNERFIEMGWDMPVSYHREPRR